MSDLLIKALTAYGLIKALTSKPRITITPAPITIKLDGRVLSEQVVRYTLSRAARSPSSLVGTSHLTTPRVNGA